ncbi:MAG: 4-hydroxy-3-methylbut-2-enyl diphosphate reductase [Deltaproteobacteria bacterium]|nr:4-hydroxy-3-methylbut-2-enyl diphosphate reductase [Candidatus Zymogenaceae bacterium]
MRVIIAKSAGFCMGVRRAMSKAFLTLKKEKGPIYTYGPLIHNPQVVRLLSEKGVLSVTDVSGTDRGTIVIRAHGISPQERMRVRATHLKIVDATCPKVMKIHAAAKKHHRQGYLVVVVGDRDHPEVSGILGYTEGKGVVVGSPQEVKDLPDAGRVLVVAQTTYSQEMFSAILEEIGRRYPAAELEAVDTLCDSTKRRQDEVRELAGRVDAMVVVGGRDSGNTRRLFETAIKSGVPSFRIEDENDLNPSDFAGFKTVGLTAGASTPNWVIMRVCDRLVDIDRSRRSWPVEALTGMLRFVVNGYLWAGLAAGGLGTAAALLMGVDSFFWVPVVSGLYVFSMHLINRVVDTEGTHFNDPSRERLFLRRRAPFMITAVVSSLGAIFIAWRLSGIIGLLVGFAVLMGLIFTAPIIPAGLQRRLGYGRIKDIPASKTFLVAAAWAAVSAGVPYLLEASRIGPVTFLTVFVLCFLVVFIRASLYDIRDIQGDAVVGRETIPVIIGKPWTQRLVLILTGVVALILALSVSAGLVTSLGWWLMIVPGYCLFTLWLYHRRVIFQGITFEVMVDLEFILAGVVSTVWFVTK